MITNRKTIISFDRGCNKIIDLIFSLCRTIVGI